jgi:hypothetical protein
MRQDADLEMALDALYGPLYYRLLTGNKKFQEGYAEALTDIVLKGIANPHHGQAP